MKKLLFISLLIIGCEEVTKPLEDDCAGVIGGTAYLDNCNVCDSDPTNDCMDSYFPAQRGNHWTYACNTLMNYSNGELEIGVSGFSSINIIDDNLESNSCGQNRMIIEKTDSNTEKNIQ